MKKLEKLLIALLMTLSMCACQKQEETYDTPDLGDEQTEEVLEDCEEIEWSEDNPIVYHVDAGSDDYLGVYCAYVSKTGNYNIEMTGIDSLTMTMAGYTIFSEYGNLLLDLTNYDENQEHIDKTSIVGNVDLVAGQPYYVMYFADYVDADMEEFTATITPKLLSTDIDVEVLKDQITQTFTDYDAKVVSYTATKDGYCYLETISDDENSFADIYHVLDEDGNDVYLGEGLCWLEKGARYYIVYGTDDFIDEVNITLYCYELTYTEVKEVDTLDVVGPTLIHYTGANDEDILVYSISKIDSAAYAYNEDLDVIAQNDDANNMFSDNDEDFAFVMNVKKDKNYYVFIDLYNGEECEIHFEKYE